MTIKTKKLTIKILANDKTNLERVAELEGEPIAVVVRRMIRQGVDQYMNTHTTHAAITVGGQDNTDNGTDKTT